MLRRLQDLLHQKVDFAFETMLATRSFVSFINQAKQIGYTVHLIFYWLNSVELAIERVKIRGVLGGHNIPTETIIRRYDAGLRNFIHLCKDSVDYWMLMDNSKTEPVFIATGGKEQLQIINSEKWLTIHKLITDDAGRN